MELQPTTTYCHKIASAVSSANLPPCTSCHALFTTPFSHLTTAFSGHSRGQIPGFNCSLFAGNVLDAHGLRRRTGRRWD
jgi:hypothetical protein